MTHHRPACQATRAAAALLTAAALAVAAAGCGRGQPGDQPGGQAPPPLTGSATSQTVPGQGAPSTAPPPPTSPTTVLADPPATLPEASPTSRAARGVRRIEILGPAEGATVGPTFDLRLDVRGFTLVEPNGNLDGTSGHLYVIVDGPPPPSNQLVRPGSGPVRLVGERMTIRNLAPGRHRILVIGANGYTVPFDPPVRATRTVTVRG